MVALFKEIEDLGIHTDKKYFDDGAFQQNFEFTELMLNTAIEGLKHIYDKDTKGIPFNTRVNQSSYTWLIEKLFDKDIRQRKTKSSAVGNVTAFKLYSSLTDNTPVDFISAKKKFAEMLKNSYIAKYASDNQ